MIAISCWMMSVGDCIAAEPTPRDLIGLAFIHGWAPGETRRAPAAKASRRVDETTAELEVDLAIMRAMVWTRS
jgi:hypothetical protein